MTPDAVLRDFDWRQDALDAILLILHAGRIASISLFCPHVSAFCYLTHL